MSSDNIVILVHGFNDNASRMKNLEKHLFHLGWDVYSVSLLPSSGRVGIDELASQLGRFINKNIGLDRKIDLVGFSMGGLICRYYIQRLGGLQRTERLITISTPHYGTWMAYLLNNIGARQMRFNCEFLRDLNKDIQTLTLLKVTSIYTPFDLMILPSSSSNLYIGKNIRVMVLLHPLMAYNNTCLDIVATELLQQ